MYTKKKIRTSRLFPQTGFLTGMGSVLNISGNYFDFRHSESDSEVDAKALASDWGMVYQDVQEVLDTQSRKTKTDESKTE